jgi:hypothetical protein
MPRSRVSNRELASILAAAGAGRNGARDYTLLSLVALTGLAPGIILGLTVKGAWSLADDMPQIAPLVEAYVRSLLDSDPGSRMFDISARQAQRIARNAGRVSGIGRDVTLFDLAYLGRDRRAVAVDSELASISLSTMPEVMR